MNRHENPYFLLSIALTLIVGISSCAIVITRKAIEERMGISLTPRSTESWTGRRSIQVLPIPSQIPEDVAPKVPIRTANQDIIAGSEPDSNWATVLSLPADLSDEIKLVCKVEELFEHVAGGEKFIAKGSRIHRALFPMVAEILASHEEIENRSDRDAVLQSLFGEEQTLLRELKNHLSRRDTEQSKVAINDLRGRLSQLVAKMIVSQLTNEGSLDGMDELTLCRHLLTISFTDLFRWTLPARTRLSPGFIGLHQPRSLIYRKLFESICLDESTGDNLYRIFTGRIGGSVGNCNEGIYCEIVISREGRLNKILFELD